MRTLPSVIATFVLVFAFVPTTTAAEEVARANVSVQVSVAARTSLRVSSELLQFSIVDGGGQATATVDVSAGARTPAGSPVVLSVEPLGGLEGPGGPAAADTSIRFAGTGQGLLSGTLSPAGAVVGRWQGSGLHEGRLVFILRANAQGTFSLPVRFVLSAP